MIKITPYILSIFALMTTVTLLGCGDGVHAARKPMWGSEIAGPATDVSEDVETTKLQCINLVNYEDMDFGNLTEGQITNASDSEISEQDKNLRAVDYNALIMKTNRSRGRLPTEIIRIYDCIESAIANMDNSGSRVYWKDRNYLLTREKLSNRPAAAGVEVIEFIGCEQLTGADCLLVD